MSKKYIDPDIDELVTEFFLEYVLRGLADGAIIRDDQQASYFFKFDDDQLLHLLPCLKHYWGMMLTVDLSGRLLSKLYFDNRQSYIDQIRSLNARTQTTRSVFQHSDSIPQSGA